MGRLLLKMGTRALRRGDLVVMLARRGSKVMVVKRGHGATRAVRLGSWCHMV